MYLRLVFFLLLFSVVATTATAEEKRGQLMALREHLVFSLVCCVAALAAASFTLFYVLMSLTQVTALIDALFPDSPESAPNGLRQLFASITLSLIGGESPMFLNQSAFAASALLLVLVILLVLVDEALLRAKEKVRAWGKLPSVEVLHHYNRNSYDVALATVGRGFLTKKPM
jgi:hypothetical protein